MKNNEQITYVAAIDANVLFANSSRAKRLSITVKPDGSVRVAIPRGVNRRTAEQFLAFKAPWVRKHLQRIANRPPAAEPTPLNPVDRRHATHHLTHRLDQLAKQYNFKFSRVTIRLQKSRWGSCSSKNNISLNARLINLPTDLIDYVLLHELLHTKIKNHSNKFWTSLEKLIPDVKTSRKKLRQFSCRG